MSNRKSKQSKADIAKQFDLPERQSKITTLLNQAGQAYCICRSSDSSRFMIACDACEEWYHGDCINISEREAKYIKNYFCDRCREEDPSLKTRFRPQKRENEGDSVPIAGRDDKKKKRKEKDRSENKSSKRASTKDGCGDCSGCLQLNDCGHCETCEEIYKYGGSRQAKLKCKMRMCVKTKSKASKQSSSSRPKKKHYERSPPEWEECIAHLQTSYPRQCNGPECERAALYGSKYCGVECGVALAAVRLTLVLPPRLQGWSVTPCVAEQRNRKSLEVVRNGIAKAQSTLRNLDKQHKEIDALVARAKTATIVHTEEKEADDETSMYCITCGHEIHSRTAVKHMEKCFVKYEAQASFGSRHRTRIDGQSMFCDYYNPGNGTYCKRLRVMCPEHFKDPKVSDTDVCGCPLVRNVFEPTGDFCRAPKKSCLKHYQWEKLRRAEIDMERVRQWLRLDELVEQERSIRLAMASRAGVMGLMLHSTFDLEVDEKKLWQTPPYEPPPSIELPTPNGLRTLKLPVKAKKQKPCKVESGDYKNYKPKQSKLGSSAASLDPSNEGSQSRQAPLKSKGHDKMVFGIPLDKSKNLKPKITSQDSLEAEKISRKASATFTEDVKLKTEDSSMTVHPLAKQEPSVTVHPSIKEDPSMSVHPPIKQELSWSSYPGVSTQRPIKPEPWSSSDVVSVFSEPPQSATSVWASQGSLNRPSKSSEISSKSAQISRTFHSYQDAYRSSQAYQNRSISLDKSRQISKDLRRTSDDQSLTPVASPGTAQKFSFKSRDTVATTKITSESIKSNVETTKRPVETTKSPINYQ